MQSTIRIGHRVARSEIYGPGIRSVIWVQGCTLACEGCWNTQFWSRAGGNEIEIDDLLNWVDSNQGINGVTILGGEPLQQAPSVLDLILELRNRGLHVFLYTGYSPEEFDTTMQACFDSSDIVVSGRFKIEERDTSLRWRGSKNQIIHYPNSNEPVFLEELNEVEITITHDGKSSLLGYPDTELMEVLDNASSTI